MGSRDLGCSVEEGLVLYSTPTQWLLDRLPLVRWLPSFLHGHTKHCLLIKIHVKSECRDNTVCVVEAEQPWE